MKRHGRLAWLVAILATLSLFATACGDSGGDDDSSSGGGDGPSGEATEEAAELSGQINGSGASFPDAFYQEAIAGFADVAPGLEVVYNAIGSSSGKEELGANLNDFAGTDSLVSDGDGPEEGSFFYIPSTAASVSLAYNLPGVDELNLSADLLAQIFQREITSWDDDAIAEVNPDTDLPSTEITVVRRADGSGTTANFTAYLESAAPDTWELGSSDTVEWPADTQGGQQNTGVGQLISDNEGAIGYLDLGDAEEIGLQSALIENAEGNFVAPSVDATTAALDGAELGDDLTYDPLNGPGEDAYPITAPTYILVRASYPDEQTRDNVVGFIRWLITDAADTYAADVGFAPIPESFRERALAQLDEVGVG